MAPANTSPPMSLTRTPGTFAGCDTQNGFTLFELLIVLTILSVVAGLSGIVLSRTVPKITINNEFNTIESHLKRARAEAMRSSLPVTISFKENSYTIKASDSVSHYRPKNTFLIVSPDNSLTFFPDGGADGVTITLNKGQHSRQLAVQSYTGYIHEKK